MEKSQINDFMLNLDFIKIILSNKRNKDSKYNKIVCIPTKNDGNMIYTCESFTDTQAFHTNFYTKNECINFLIKEFFSVYKQINIFTTSEQYEIRESKKGKLNFIKQINSQVKEKSNTKNYLLKAEDKILPLIDLGIITQDGKVVNKEYKKFKQINKFIEIIDSSLKDFKKDSINIVDFGCGKSYLTFLLYYYLSNVKNINVNIIGLDLKSEVVEKCNIIAEKYKYKNLNFKISDIKDYVFTQNVDMMITLHACDTATDYALFNAITNNIKYILSVPCCQHELKSQMNNKLNIITKYGILKDKFCATLTDAIRCELLNTVGYKTQIVEFIEESETPKNLMIKAIKSNNVFNKTKFNDVENIIQAFDLKPTLYSLIKQKYKVS